jgi:glycosyltransferase involved in cell wall biosynthesis
MALGLSVIATKVGRVPLTIFHGENGFLYEPGNMGQLHELAAMLSQLPTDHRKKIGETARKTVVEEYDIGKCADSYLREFTSLLGRAGRFELFE